MAILKPIEETVVELSIVGSSPLITHAWSEKALKMLRLTAAERRKIKKEKRDPEAEALGSAYYMEDGSYGIPLTGLKSAIVSAAHKDLGLARTTVQRALFIPQSDASGNVPLELEGEPRIREDIVRVGNKQTDLRYRCEFFPWRARFSMIIDPEVLSIEDLVTLVDRAGFAVGLCEWRPENGGEFGRFRVDVNEKVQQMPRRAA